MKNNTITTAITTALLTLTVATSVVNASPIAEFTSTNTTVTYGSDPIPAHEHFSAYNITIPSALTERAANGEAAAREADSTKPKGENLLDLLSTWISDITTNFFKSTTPTAIASAHTYGEALIGTKRGSDDTGLFVDSLPAASQGRNTSFVPDVIVETPEGEPLPVTPLTELEPTEEPSEKETTPAVEPEK